MKKYISHSEIDTKNYAYEFAKKLKNNDIIVLSGNLGAGKTKFMQGIGKYFGIENEISSPTFTIVNEYLPSKNIDNVNKIFHFDVYRLTDADDFENSVGLDYFYNGLCILEWGEIVKDILPINTIYISIQYSNPNDPNERAIIIEGDNL